MKILLDQGAGRSAAAMLRAGGLEASHVAEHGMSSALDEEIISFAHRTGAIVVTFDHDFHELLALSGARTPSVIFVRDEHLKSAQLAELVATLCQRYEEALRAGAVITVRHGLVRMRLLPLRSGE